MKSHARPGYRCPFCALIAGTDCEGLYSRQDDIVCNDGVSMAFIASHWWEKNPGHVLVVPTGHFENLYEVPDDVGANIFAMSRRIAIAMKHSCHCEGISTR